MGGRLDAQRRNDGLQPAPCGREHPHRATFHCRPIRKQKGRIGQNIGAGIGKGKRTKPWVICYKILFTNKFHKFFALLMTYFQKHYYKNTNFYESKEQKKQINF